MDDREVINKAADAITRHFADEGRLVESGWVTFRRMVIPANASDIQVQEMRLAFMAGAQHLWGSIMSLEDGDENPEAIALSSARLEKINDELNKFVKDCLELRLEQPKGSA